MGRQSKLAVMTPLVLVFVLMGLSSTIGQHLDPNLEDKAYLDQIDADVQAEVNEMKIELIKQAKYTQDVARNYVGAKLKENLFKALRVLAEKESEALAKYYANETKQSKQEDDGEDEDGSGGGSDGTTRRPNNILPQIGNLVKVLFGGNSINLTAYVESATNLLPTPIQSQIVGVVKILAHNPSKTTTTAPIKTTIITIFNGTNINDTTTVANATAIINGTLVPVKIDILGQNVSSTTTEGSEGGGSAEDEGEEVEEEDSRRREGSSRQINLPNLPSLTNSLNFLGMLFGGTTSRPSTAAPVMNVRRRGSSRPVMDANGTTESASGFEEEREDQMNQFSIEGLANSVRNGIGDMIRIAPDLFKGAREAVNLLTGLSSFIGGLDLD